MLNTHDSEIYECLYSVTSSTGMTSKFVVSMLHSLSGTGAPFKIYFERGFVFLGPCGLSPFLSSPSLQSAELYVHEHSVNLDTLVT